MRFWLIMLGIILLHVELKVYGFNFWDPRMIMGLLLIVVTIWGFILRYNYDLESKKCRYYSHKDYIIDDKYLSILFARDIEFKEVKGGIIVYAEDGNIYEPVKRIL